MARTMKRKSRTNKKFGKKNGKRSSKKVYKKKMTKKSRRSSRKMRGGDNPFDTDESVIPEDEDETTNVSVGSISLGNTEDGETDSEAETTPSQNSFSNLTGLNQSGVDGVNQPGVDGVNQSFNSSDSSLHLSALAGPSANSSGVTDTSSSSFDGGRRKGKKTQKKRRVKKGGELPADFNPNDREDLDHN